MSEHSGVQRLFRWAFRPPHPALTGDVHQTWPGKRWLQKPGPWCRTKARLGRRGAMLVTLGLLYAAIGYRELAMTAPVIPGAWLFLVPVSVRASLWFLTGFLAILSCTRGRGRTWWRTDTPGWLVLCLMPGITMLSYTWSWSLWAIYDFLLAETPPAVLHGQADAWTNVVIRMPLLIVPLICSGWVENPRRNCD